MRKKNCQHHATTGIKRIILNIYICPINMDPQEFYRIRITWKKTPVSNDQHSKGLPSSKKIPAKKDLQPKGHCCNDRPNEASVVPLLSRPNGWVNLGVDRETLEAQQVDHWNHRVFLLKRGRLFWFKFLKCKSSTIWRLRNYLVYSSAWLPGGKQKGSQIFPGKPRGPVWVAM